MQLSVKKAGLEKNDGKTPDIILIHGTGANADMWQPQVQMLVKYGYRCFLPELRGHGETDEPGEKTDIEVHVNDLLESINKLDIVYPAIFVGHSLGAIVSFALAEKNPQFFMSILAVAMPARIVKPVSHAFKWFLKWPYQKLRGTSLHQRLPWRERTMLNTHQHSLEQIAVNFHQLDFLDKPFQVTCPVHFAVGRLDPVALFFLVKRMHKSMPSSTFKVFEWAGHNCMDEQPEKFNQWLLEKLKR